MSFSRKVKTGHINKSMNNDMAAKLFQGGTIIRHPSTKWRVGETLFPWWLSSWNFLR
ncbi:MAG: hypothetical protein M5F18_04405 [Asgard group archaeon]|nr:hypothetical protein [Asgard group archaeon]